MEVKSKQELKSRKDQETEAQAEPQRRASEVELGCQKTEAEPVGLRTKAKPKG